MVTTAAPPHLAPDRAPRRRRGSRLMLRNLLIGWTFILPNFIGFAVLTLVPVLTLFYMSFTDWNIFGSSSWIGLDNFTRLAGDATFRTSLWNTLYFTAVHVPLTLAASLGLALLLNRKLRGVTFFRTVAFFPYITSIVAIAAVWNMLFSPELGPINQFLRFIGIENPPEWTVSTTWSMPAVIIVSTWRFMGYYMLLFLAGLQTVPRELHEAARMDGAGAWQRFLNVTMPCLRPTTFFVTVMLTINALKVFDLVLVMTNGGPGTSTMVISQFIWQRGFTENQFGYAAAAAVVLFGLSIAITIFQFLWNKRREA
ncbi:carbohydrate ABC transporter permease [Cellulomonas denverensis]|uniref:Sugar ABC transporter permease n=1 Tax=Cellulomonas denverensis TaxID=264297 RepID=A0A7X6QY19_9CELL|nr:sugar ABC transporter permease [Cellulomonas denverensis]NKY21521.1 sugar ABC transporter permease [Cellulomonas denverensis]GIG25412.1 ABC transporter permease [Cellulomonas denverensis]